jgi:hypothetical protein
MGVVCGLNGGCTSDRKIPNNYVVVVIREVFIIDMIIIDPLNSIFNNKPKVILFWSSKFLRQDLTSNA